MPATAALLKAMDLARNATVLRCKTCSRQWSRAPYRPSQRAWRCFIAQRALERFYRKITPGAIALVFFSGYGTAPILGVAN